MKYFFLSILMIFYFLPGFCQEKTGWYKTYTGKAGNMDAVLHLTATTKDYNGYIWFKQNQYPILMVGQKVNGDSIRLGSMDGLINLTLTGKMENNKFRGSVELQMANENVRSKRSSFELCVDSIFTPFKFIYVNAGARMPPRLKNESTFTAFEGTVWPVNNDAIAEKIKNSIRVFNEIPKDREVLTWYFQKIEKMRNDWQRDNGKLTPKEASELGLSLSVDSNVRTEVMYENDNTITFSRFIFDYSGGAHGNYAIQLKNISKRSGNTIELKDLLSAEGIRKLPAYLEQVARIQYKTGNGPLKDNGFLTDHIPVSKEFYITSNGIGFLYAPYEIKSFADGEINLLVPFAAIRQYINRDFKY